MIQTEDLSKQFNHLTAVDGVSLQVDPGEVLALLGPNGAGKTTTVRMLTSVLRPSRGWARVAGFDVVRQAGQVRARVGVLTEQHGLYGRMPADDYLDFYGKLYGMDAVTRRKNSLALLEGFGLLADAHRRVGEYSKGMRQKLALARALLHDPPVLLLDEPTSAMDPESARLVRDAIHSLRSEKRAIIICTHNLAEAEELSDHIAIIRRGKIIAKGTPEDLKQRLLGTPEYEVRLAAPQPQACAGLVPWLSLTQSGSDWFRYQTDSPEKVNPAVLKSLLDRALPVVGLYQVPRSLEQVYLRALDATNLLEEGVREG